MNGMTSKVGIISAHSITKPESGKGLFGYSKLDDTANVSNAEVFSAIANVSCLDLITPSFYRIS